MTVRSPGSPDQKVAAIGPGLCVFVGVTHDDVREHAVKLADRVWNLRVFEDSDANMNLSCADRVEAGRNTEVLVVSQFTLYADTSRGRRPSFIAAARPEVAEPLIEVMVDELRRVGAPVQTGRFRTDMAVEILNDGPVTILLEV